jgi:four helix bundle protein
MKKNHDKANRLEERLIQFAVSIINLSNKLPKTHSGKHISGQILRSGTSPAPNYGEARGAESKADFVHKLGVVLKELNETLIWLKIINKCKLIKEEFIGSKVPAGWLEPFLQLMRKNQNLILDYGILEK